MLDITVEFGSDHFRAGQGEFEMMTYNGQHRWVFPLVPTACDYAKQDDYFGKFQKSQISALQAQGNFGGHLEFRKVAKSKSQRLESKMGKFKTIIQDMEETIRNTFARFANVLSRSEMGKIPAG